MAKSCVLAYSGGLDTSAIIPWLLDQGWEVHALLVDVGQVEPLDELANRALQLGAASTKIVDVQEEMLAEAGLPAIGLAAVYEGQYRLGTALARPFIAKAQVEYAKQIGARALVHGATGKGNDQIRFEFAYRSLAPEMEILAPWKEWSFVGRKDLIDYLEHKGFVYDFPEQKVYSLDKNFWHTSIEGGELEDPAATLDIEAIIHNALPESATNRHVQEQSTVSITLSAGIPCEINGQKVDVIEALQHLNQQFEHDPMGWDLVLENRFTGIKSRGIYLNPGAVLLQTAADALARASFTEPTFKYWQELGNKFAEKVYRGEWFSLSCQSLIAAAKPILQQLSGTVTFALKPKLHVVKLEAEKSLFNQALASFETHSSHTGHANGYIAIQWQRHFGETDHGKSALESKDSTASELRSLAPLSR